MKLMKISLIINSFLFSGVIASPYQSKDVDYVWHCVKKHQIYSQKLWAIQHIDRYLSSFDSENTISSPRLLEHYRAKVLKWYKRSQVSSWRLRHNVSLKNDQERSFWDWTDVLMEAYYNDHSFTRSLKRFREFYQQNPAPKLRPIERALSGLAGLHRAKVERILEEALACP